ncbi:DUF1571 domain-containing protein [Hymenobacter sp. RP-2-7]|uniref:DUF1571 domain-containing protein n=1 Tax=Hymenobacter polaris TaxID=2682546 RepID=A0A7Y0ACE6_9BACT|nr:DUF1571 domain-containing protein [Hymenobacter polaris]NML64779.1 DUF1571 domain-containing protein [Hymenobacter polaris]
MKYIVAGVLAAAGALLLAAARPAASSRAPITTPELESRLLAAIDGTQSLRYVVAAQERVEGRYLPMRSTVKLTLTPLRIYLKNQQGAEALYVAGQNGGDAWVYPGTFPYLTLSLDPRGSLMLRNQHHSLLQIGFGLIASLLRTSEPAFVRSFRAAGDTVVGGRPCHVLRSSYPAFRYIAYRAGAGETTASVATKLNCGEYRILERNKLAVNTKLAAGQVIQVPNAYGSRTVVLVDERTFLPAGVAVYDERGLYEKYDFSNVVANQPIPATEFSKDFPGYKF